MTPDSLRKAGYMTIDEFIDTLVPGLHEYLRTNWGPKDESLHHPEDLFANASIYLDVARHVVADFGAKSRY